MEEKKVEYIELIYDLIFVYIVGRNNELLHVISNGFIAPSAFLTYIVTALIVLQIWYYTTMYVNRHGENDKIMYAGIFINMYLLYYMAKGIRADWQGYYTNFNIAWALILINIAVMYMIRLRYTDKTNETERGGIRRNIVVLLVQATMVLVSVPVYRFTGVPLAPACMLFGIVMSIAGRCGSEVSSIDFNHLTERVMLYVVFTFGEMIIGIAGYFDGSFSANTVYFSLCCFLIVVGLFVSYGYLYDHILDRNMTTNGTAYVMLHMFLILALNHITAALEFMREAEVAELPKNLFLIGSFVLFFVLMYYIAHYSRADYKFSRKFSFELFSTLVIFVVLMLITYKQPRISIAVTLMYIIFIYELVSRHKRTNEMSGIPDGFTADDIRIEASICNGERTIGFYNESEKKLYFAELVKTDDDIADFYKKYGLKRK